MKSNSKRTWLFVIPLLIFMAAMVMFYFRLGKDTQVQVSTTLNKPLPIVHLPLLSDLSRTMTNDDLPKKPFILNVWGSWCPACRLEHPFLMQLHAQGVPMVGVNYKDELPDALAYLNEHQDPFVYSLQDLDGSYGIELGLTGAPESFVVSADGKVYQHLVGVIDEQNWQNQLQPCLTALADETLDETDKQTKCQQPKR